MASWASRVIQRLHEVLQHNPNVRIFHLMRPAGLYGFRNGRTRHEGENHWELKLLGWPKSCWSYLIKMEKADDQKRDQLLNDWGSTTTAGRKDWRQII